ncbi:Hypothetical protein MexAM1_META1p4966 [Methylorubrum extorquens AM1]|uniref:Uncharacterized protein n=1 Tax=Methylorubrum extorquens (strain ATCC 14718 / DSM 1338 / JCM 2805 / NCIMB 9133 / AM1) TaxID=272630 RepID=C5ASV7_METEA|nr:Hypothetical protein MexAM1_META1p4966 [Methylorubrum extorquens AM1]
MVVANPESQSRPLQSELRRAGLKQSLPPSGGGWCCRRGRASPPHYRACRRAGRSVRLGPLQRLSGDVLARMLLGSVHLVSADVGR